MPQQQLSDHGICGHAALLFYALEVFVLKGPLSSWLRKVFGQNRKLSPTQVEYAVTQAACRIVGSVHFLIQVSCSHSMLHHVGVMLRAAAGPIEGQLRGHRLLSNPLCTMCGMS